MKAVFEIIRKFSNILSKHQKMRIVELIVLMIIGGFIETLSVALILPFMNALMNPSQVMGNRWVALFCKLFQINEYRHFVMALAFVLAVIYIVKNIFLLFEYNVQYKFANNNMFAFKTGMLTFFLNQPYEYYLSASSGEILQLINTDVNNVFSALSVLLGFLTEFVVSTALIITTFMLAPIMTFIIALVLLLLLFGIQFFVKPILEKAGRKQRSGTRGMNTWLLQSIEGIKELKVMRREEYFISSFKRYGADAAKYTRQYAILNIMPRFLIEAISMSSILISIAAMVLLGWRLESLVPMLSGVAMAAVRLLPSVNRISASLGTLAYSEPVIDHLTASIEQMREGYSDLDRSVSVKGKHISAVDNIQDGIEVCGVSYKYPDGENKILNNISIRIPKGASVGIEGESGAGKTTLVNLMLGLLRPTEGEIRVDGVNIFHDMANWYAHIGYIPQTIFLLDDTIRSNVIFGERDDGVDDDHIWRVLDEAAIGDFVRMLPRQLDTEIGERGIRLSGGQRQRLGIARALFNSPDVLFFDEATSALDSNTEKSIMESIENMHGKKTMIIVAHRLTTIEKCDYIYQVKEGRAFLRKA